MPVLRSDDAASGIVAEKYLPDPRVSHFWDGERMLGNEYGKALELPRDRSLAWDIYFVFPAGVRWEESIPIPEYWAHQLAMDGNHLGDGTQLRDAIIEAISH